MKTKTLKVTNADLFESVREALESGSEVKLRTKGNSMTPLLIDGRDNVVLVRLNPMQVCLGMIVLAKLNQTQYCIHRVIKIEPDSLVLMGDGNLTQTERIASSQAIAYVKHIERKGKIIQNNSLFFRFYAKSWIFLTPLRRYLLKIYRKVR